MNIDKMLENYQSVDELKIFCAAQLKQIQILTKKNKELEEQLEKAKKAPTLPVASSMNVSKEDAKTIAEIQLFMLKQEAMNRELDMDEAKRVELYNRILKDDSKKEKESAGVETASMGELLKLVENNG